MSAHHQSFPKTSLFPLYAKGELQRPEDKIQSILRAKQKAATKEILSRKVVVNSQLPQDALKSGLRWWEGTDSPACSAHV